MICFDSWGGPNQPASTQKTSNGIFAFAAHSIWLSIAHGILFPPPHMSASIGSKRRPLPSRGDLKSRMKRWIVVRNARAVTPERFQSRTDGARNVSPGRTRKFVSRSPPDTERRPASSLKSAFHEPVQPTASSYPSFSAISMPRNGMTPSFAPSELRPQLP